MIYLIRHGQTVLNLEGRYQGRVDSPLTPLGVAQAEAVGRRLAELRAAGGGDWRLEVSPLGRTRQMAGIVGAIAGLGPAAIDARLIEAGYGEFEGLTRPEVDARWPEFTGLQGTFGRAPGGESMEQIYDRTRSWLADHRESGVRRTVAISHASTGRVLRGLYLGLTLEETRVLETPQDAFHLLRDGEVTRIEAGPLPSPAPEA
ncbi:MAG TPA: histidine phosphatase family protein [Caulobacteraceae bacterium]|nr:histidine phosphatase family protein [Caulobacteraceae bacterium]